MSPLFCTPQLYQILTDIQNCFTVRIRRKFVVILSLKIPPHLKCVATLPCEISSVLKATDENKTTSEVKHPTLTVTKFFINKQNFLKNTDQMPVTSVMTSLSTGGRIGK